MSDKEKPAFNAINYWNDRYGIIDATKSGHIDLPAEYNHWLYRRKQDNVAKGLRAVGGTLCGNKLLEIAAGSGAWMAFWQSHGVADYFGTDLSACAVAGLAARFPDKRFQQRDLNDLGLAGAVGTGYDSVAAIDVLYHVIDDDQFCRVMVDIATVMKPGALLIIHDQFVHGAAQDHRQYIRWRALVQYEPVLDLAGFDIVYRRPSFFFMIQNADYTGRAAKILKFVWDNLTYPFIEKFPRLAGAIGYAIDTVICAFLCEGPSMEIMVCRKRG